MKISDKPDYLLLEDFGQILGQAEEMGLISPEDTVWFQARARERARGRITAAARTNELRARCAHLAKDLAADAIRTIESQRRRDSLAYQADMRREHTRFEGSLAEAAEKCARQRLEIQKELNALADTFDTLSENDPGRAAVKRRQRELGIESMRLKADYHRECVRAHDEYRQITGAIKSAMVERFDDATRRIRCARAALRETLGIIRDADSDRLHAILAELGPEPEPEKPDGSEPRAADAPGTPVGG